MFRPKSARPRRYGRRIGGHAALVAALLFALVVPAWSPASAEAPKTRKATSDLKSVERAIKRAKTRQTRLQREEAALARQVRILRSKLVGAAKAIHSGEAMLTRFEAELTKLRGQEKAIERKLTARRMQVARTVAALQRLSLNPPEATIGHQRTATETVRGGLAIRASVPHLQAQIAALKRELAERSAVRVRIARQLYAIEDTTRRLERNRVRLAALLKGSETLRRRTRQARQRTTARMSSLVSRSRSLRELMESLERPRAKPPTAPPPAKRRTSAARKVPNVPFSKARGRVQLPARGRIVRRFGQRGGTAAFGRGIVIKTRPGAQVVAPFYGRVVFAGRFRDYGVILILEHSEGYHTLLAGMARLTVAENRTLVRGEPVGTMSSSQSGRTRLYLEIRRKGNPINPLPWLAAKTGKVNG